MTNKKVKEVFAKILGHRVKSFTRKGVEYTVIFDEEHPQCTCPDFKYRNGSYFLFVSKDGKEIEIEGCKHIAKVLRELGYKVEMVRKR